MFKVCTVTKQNYNHIRANIITSECSFVCSYIKNHLNDR